MLLGGGSVTLGFTDEFASSNVSHLSEDWTHSDRTPEFAGEPCVNAWLSGFQNAVKVTMSTLESIILDTKVPPVSSFGIVGTYLQASAKVHLATASRRG